MRLALSTLVMLYAFAMALWPLAWLVALVRQSLAKRWRRAAQLAMLLPLWTIAASIGVVQLPSLRAVPEAAPSSPRVLVAVTSIGVAACFGAVAWLLLLRSFDLRKTT